MSVLLRMNIFVLFVSSSIFVHRALSEDNFPWVRPNFVVSSEWKTFCLFSWGWFSKCLTEKWISKYGNVVLKLLHDVQPNGFWWFFRPKCGLRSLPCGFKSIATAFQYDFQIEKGSVGLILIQNHTKILFIS